VVRVKNRKQLGDGQQIGDPLRQIEQFQLAALPADGGECPYNLTETCAVDVGDRSQIEHDLLAPLIQQTVHLVLEHLVAVAQLHAALDVQYHNVTDRSFVDLHENAPDECVPVS